MYCFLTLKIQPIRYSVSGRDHTAPLSAGISAKRRIDGKLVDLNVAVRQIGERHGRNRFHGAGVGTSRIQTEK
jgi:hypothetical protein